MTTLRKSDAQLDAEAARRPIAESIELHRGLYRDDLTIKKLTTETPPVLTDPNTGRRNSDPMSMIGPTLSLPLTRFITDEYGYLFPWLRAVQIMRYRLCRKEHPEHLERPEFRGSLCSELVTMTIRQEYLLPRACFELGTTPERSERVLTNALYWVEECMDAQRQRQEDKRAADVGRNRWWEEVHHERHDIPGLHAEECPQCLRRRAMVPAIAS
jgi:hypothetical protein